MIDVQKMTTSLIRPLWH